MRLMFALLILVGMPAVPAASFVDHLVDSRTIQPTSESIRAWTVRKAMTTPSHLGKPARETIHLAADEAIVATAFSHESMSLTLPISQTTSLDLDLHRFSILAPDSKFIVMRGGQPTIVAAPEVRLLRGTVRGEPGSRVMLALTPRGAGSGTITRGDGSILTIGSDRDPNDGRPRGLIVQHGPGDVPEFPEFCRMIDTGLDDGPALAGAGPSPALGPRILRVAIDSDLSFRNLFTTDEDALAHIVAVLGAVDDIYRRDLNFTLQLVFTRLWPEGGEPFGANSLSGFRDYWIKFENPAEINLVHLFSGRRDLSYGGIAYLANACNDFGYGISAFLLGSMPADPLTPSLGTWDVVVVAHEMGHNLGTPHTHDYDPPIDTCTSGTFERGTIMSYCHTRPGGLLNTDMRMHREVANFLAAHNANVTCLRHDCNGNGVDDESDILLGNSLDANLDNVPDDCQDCNNNGTLDPIELAAGAADFDANGVLDACEADCNANFRPDVWECNNSGADLNGNSIPDTCDPDCNGNGLPDHQDILFGVSLDLDRDSVPDECQDCNRNGLSDWLDVGRQGNIFISQQDGRVREYHRASAVAIGSVAEAMLVGAHDLAFGPDRQLYVADFVGNRIARIDVDTNTVSTFIAPGTGGLASPSGLAFGLNGNLYVVSQGSSRVLEFNGSTGALVRQFQTVGGTVYSVLNKITFGPGPQYDVFVTSPSNRVIRFSNATGLFVSQYVTGAGSGLSDPRGLVFLPDGTLLVANFGGDRITRYDSSGTLIGKWNDEYPLNDPWALSIGPNGNVYAANFINPVRVIEYDSANGRYLRGFVRGDNDLDTPPTAIVFRSSSPADANQNNIPDVCEVPLCVADIAPVGSPPGNGVVNVQDLLAVISAWGPCANPNACPADIAPPGPPGGGGDDVVNVADLLAVIAAWGPCR